MSSFIRFAGAAAVVLSLGLFATALPLVLSVEIPVIIGKDAVSLVCAKLFVELDIVAKIKALLDCATMADLDVAIKSLCAVIQICADDLHKVGAGVQVAVDAKLNIIACFAACITLLVQVLVQVCLKFGINAVVALCSQIDRVFCLLLVNLNTCIDGVLVSICKALATVIFTLCAQVKLDLCVALFAKVAGVVA